MPIFEYTCEECNHRFELLVHGSTVPSCPSCQTTKLKKEFSPFGVGAPEGWAPSEGSGPCGTCGDPRGPGACSMN